MRRDVVVSLWSLVLAAGVVASATVLAGPQAGAPRPGGASMQATQSTAVVLGRVIDGDTGQPVGGALVELPSSAQRLFEVGLVPASDNPDEPAQAAPRAVIADTEGRFVLRDLRPGSYLLRARMAGYLLANSGQRRPGGPSAPLQVPEHAPVVEVTLRMWQYASINGVVLDEAGDPAVGVTIRGLLAGMAGGRRTWSPTSNATTDDRGVYRLANLVPGEYYVFAPSTTTSVPVSTVEWYAQARTTGAVNPSDLLQQFRESRAPTPSPAGLRVDDHVVQVNTIRSSTSPDLGPDGRLSVYRTIYHPAATRVERAEPVRLTSGEDREGVDLRLSLEPAFVVSGEITGLDGPAAHLGVRLIPADADRFSTETGMETALTATDLQGRFALHGVPPGQYTLKALRVPRGPSNLSITSVVQTGGSTVTMSTSTLGPPAPPIDAPTLWATRDVAVGDADVDGLSLTLAEGARVSGRFEFEGATPPPADQLARMAVSLAPADGQRLPVGFSVARLGPDAAFTTVGYPPGRYFLNASAIAANDVRWTVRAVEVGGRNAVDQPIELAGDDLEGVVVRLNAQSAELAGTVQFAPGAEPEAIVLIFPSDYRTWMANGMSPRRSRTVRTDENAAFTIPGLLAGSYLAVALPAGTTVELQDPNELAGLASMGTVVQLGDSGRQTVALTVATGR
jgi:protocatechuate 3,4-dioxygenase beta subunit